jgi:hypothetical protein
VFGIVVFTGAAYLLAPWLVDLTYAVPVASVELGRWPLVLFVTAAAVVSMTWGSWAAMLWAEHPVSLVPIRGTTLAPGLAMLAFGVGGLYVGFVGIWVWAVVCASAVGTLAIALCLWPRRVRISNLEAGYSRYIVGFTVFPVITSLLAALVARTWYIFATSSASMGWDPRDWLDVATVFTTILAIELCTTALPAVVSRACQELVDD